MKTKYLALGTLCLVLVALAVLTGHLDIFHIANSSGHHLLGAMATAGAPAIEDQIKTLSGDLKKAADAVKEQGDAAQAEMKKLGRLTEETKTSADQALLKHGELSQRMSDLEQKLARRGSDQPQRAKSAGQTVVESEEFKTFTKSGQRNLRIGVKALITSLTTDADGSVGAAVETMRVPGIVTPPQRRMTIRDLMTPGRTVSGAIEYVQETGFTNNAATVSETAGSAKPQTNLKLALKVQAVTTIAHYVRATKQILADAPQMQSYIDGRLRYGLMYVEETQLLNGGGTGTDLNGIYTQASNYNAPIVPSAAGNLTKVDVIRLAMLQAFLAEYPSSGIILNPKDWADIELTKTDNGAYIFANPQNSTQPRLWGLPVVETQAMSQDTFLTGAFALGSQIFDREDADVLISLEDQDNFIKNLVTILAEERLASTVYRPEAFIKGAFTTALAQ